MKKVIEVSFKNVADFRRRIAALWQNQKEDEVYDFKFPDEATEKAFNDLVSCFSKENSPL